MEKIEKVNINIFQKVGDNSATTSEDGEIIFRMITIAFKNNKDVILDFNNINLIASVFLNASIGQLYNDYDGAYLKKHLKIENMQNEDKEILKDVIERAKEYFKDKEQFERTVKKSLDEE